MHSCPECGMEHEGSAEPAPVIVEADPGPNEHDVEIAQIEADASVEREKIWSDERALELEAQVEGLAGELRGMREVLDRLAPPEPEPEPVIVTVPAPEPEPAAEAVPPPPEAESKPGKSKPPGWWDPY